MLNCTEARLFVFRCCNAWLLEALFKIFLGVFFESFPKSHQGVYFLILYRQLFCYCSQDKTKNEALAIQALCDKPWETCQKRNETERDGCPPHTPLPTSLQYQLMIHMLPVTQWERYCNTPSASPSPDPHRHPSERQAAVKSSSTHKGGSQAIPQ